MSRRDGAGPPFVTLRPTGSIMLSPRYMGVASERRLPRERWLTRKVAELKAVVPSIKVVNVGEMFDAPREKWLQEESGCEQQVFLLQ